MIQRLTQPEHVQAANYCVRTACRICGGKHLEDVLAFHAMPLADRLLKPTDDVEEEPLFPLNVVFCPDCSLVQLREDVAEELLFHADYPYFSSFSRGWVDHCRRNAAELIELESLGPSHRVLEIASNDGYLLKHFQSAGIPVLGIDPAPGPANAARDLGIPTVERFFDKSLAGDLRCDGFLADVLLANNLLAHVTDLNGFAEAAKRVLAPNGVAVLEFPYVRDLVDKCEFDTIYHEHHCYFSLTAVDQLFRQAGLYVSDVRRLPTHGGSLRIYVRPKPARTPAVERQLREEAQDGITNYSYYATFAARTASVVSELVQKTESLVDAGRTVVGYGAAAKAATLLNAAGIGCKSLSYVVDRNRHKHGLLMPGVYLPIHGVDRLLSDMPDDVLLLAWNHREEILQQQAEYIARGGRFFYPIPQAVVHN